MEAERVGDLVGLTCMGNEGAQWFGMAPFLERKHLVQNLGDGTFFHSGSLAIRAAVASGVDITYKLLHNGTVAMTGGQDAVGAVGVPDIAKMVLLEGVSKVIVTTDDLDRYDDDQFPEGVEVWHRTRLEEAQKVLAAIPGTTVLIHDQACAAENRRARSRGKLATPDFRVVINERVCEGCGDCGAKSNCLSVQPVDTPYGRKTRIDQTSCNFDFSCMEGDCPAFATVSTDPASQKLTGTSTGAVDVSDLPEPTPVVDPSRFTVRLSGIGGTGVVTVSQILGTAAMLAGHTVRGLDQTGLSQKAGPVDERHPHLRRARRWRRTTPACRVSTCCWRSTCWPPPATRTAAAPRPTAPSSSPTPTPCRPARWWPTRPPPSRPSTPCASASTRCRGAS